VAPLEAMSQPGATPVLAVIGGQDDLTPPDDVAALDAFEHVTIASYPDAGHGFVHDPSRPAHRPDDAADAWARAITFLGST
jgi:carboxymethylenebutenolidase